MVHTGLITAHGMLHSLVRREIDSVGRSWWEKVKVSGSRSVAKVSENYHCLPAPTMTLDIPRHRLKKPSVEAIWYVLRNTPAWAVVELGAKTCIRVCYKGRGVSTQN